jgi:hypothetical protein
MDQHDIQNQPKAKFFAFENNRKRAGDTQPAYIDGQIGIPGSDITFAMPATFAKGSKVDGKYVIDRMFGWTEPTPVDTPPRDRIAAKVARENEPARAAFVGEKGPYMLEAGQYVFFRNPTAGQPGKSGNMTTDMYGYWNPGAEYPIVKIGCWMGEKNGKGYINGETQLPLPGKEDGVLPDVDPNETFEDPTKENTTDERSHGGRAA